MSGPNMMLLGGGRRSVKFLVERAFDQVVRVSAEGCEIS